MALGPDPAPEDLFVQHSVYETFTRGCSSVGRHSQVPQRPIMSHLPASDIHVTSLVPEDIRVCHFCIRVNMYFLQLLAVDAT